MIRFQGNNRVGSPQAALPESGMIKMMRERLQGGSKVPPAAPVYRTADYQARYNGLPGDRRDHPEDMDDPKVQDLLRRTKEAEASRAALRERRMGSGATFSQGMDEGVRGLHRSAVRTEPSGMPTEHRPPISKVGNAASGMRNMLASAGDYRPGGDRRMYHGAPPQPSASSPMFGKKLPGMLRPRPLNGMLRRSMALKANENKDQVFGQAEGWNR